MPPNYIGNDPPSVGHNRGVTREELTQIVEWIENINARAKLLSDERKEFMAQVKGRGYDTKIVNMIVKLRARDKDDVAEEEAILELYKEALGL